MSNNLSIKVNLTKIGGHLVNLKGNSGVTKQCIVLPIEDCNLYVGKTGVHLNLLAIALKEPKYDDTHFIKQSLEKEVYQAMSKEQQDAQPICGGIKPMPDPKTPVSDEVFTVAAPVAGADGVVPVPGEGADLPF